MFILIILPLYYQLGWGQEWENNFLTLGEEVATLIFLPCMIPCLVQLIQHVIKGMQVIATPTDPEMTIKGQKLMSLQIITKPKKTQEQEIKSMIAKVCKDNY